MLFNVYKRLISNFSKLTIFLVFLGLIASLYHSKNFNLDASSDALLLEGDKDLKYLREVNERYGSKDFLFLTYTPVSSFTDDETIVNLQFLKAKIEKLSWVERVVTLVDVPLLKSSDEPLMDRLKNYKTLSFPDIDKERGFKELINSDIYKNYVISEDGKTSAIVVYIREDKRMTEFIKIKEEYVNRTVSNKLSDTEEEKYKGAVDIVCQGIL